MGLRDASEPTEGLIAAVIGHQELDGSRFAALLATVKSVSFENAHGVCPAEWQAVAGKKII